MRRGGWGCYGPGGCGEYLLIQQLLDEALTDAYEKKHGVRMETVEFYWLDDAMEAIRPGERAVEIRWRDGDTSQEPFRIPHEQLLPAVSARRYNQFLEKVRAGKTRVKSKFLMGL